jgi:hypothetical protein
MSMNTLSGSITAIYDAPEMDIFKVGFEMKGNTFTIGGRYENLKTYVY